MWPVRRAAAAASFDLGHDDFKLAE